MISKHALTTAMAKAYMANEGTVEQAMEAALTSLCLPLGVKDVEELAKQQQIIRDLTKLITGLTPGGSEYFKRLGDDLFYADVEVCQLAIIRRARDIQAINDHKLENAKATISRLEAEEEKLRGALRPFAEVAKHDIGEDESDNDWYRPMTAHNRAAQLRVGDLRRALLVIGE